MSSRTNQFTTPDQLNNCLFTVDKMERETPLRQGPPIRRRPPLMKLDMTDGILDLSGVTVEETDTDINIQKNNRYETLHDKNSGISLERHSRQDLANARIHYNPAAAARSANPSSLILDDPVPDEHAQSNGLSLGQSFDSSPVMLSDIVLDEQSLIKTSKSKDYMVPVLDFSNCAYDA